MLSLMKLQMDIKDRALGKATTGLSVHEKNLTATAIRADSSETENALMRAKVTKVDARLSTLKLMLERKDAALINASKGLTEHKQNLTAASNRVNASEIENA